LALEYFGFQYFVLARVVTGFFAGCNPIFKAWNMQGLQLLHLQ